MCDLRSPRSHNIFDSTFWTRTHTLRCGLSREGIGIPSAAWSNQPLGAISAQTSHTRESTYHALAFSLRESKVHTHTAPPPFGLRCADCGFGRDRPVARGLQPGLLKYYPSLIERLEAGENMDRYASDSFRCGPDSDRPSVSALDSSRFEERSRHEPGRNRMRLPLGPNGWHCATDAVAHLSIPSPAKSAMKQTRASSTFPLAPPFAQARQ